MKNILWIFVIMALIGFVVACDNSSSPTGSTITFTVTFDSAGGSEVPLKTGLTSGVIISAPATPTKTFWPAGLWAGTISPEIFDAYYTFIEWRKSDNTAWDFSTDTVTANITLTAYWSVPYPAPISSVPSNNLCAAINFVNENPGTYTLLINQNIYADAQVLDSNLNLTIIGIGGKRSIQYNGATNQFFFNIDNVNANLTLGNNITLSGINDSVTSLLFLQAGRLIMKSGSKITGHHTSSLGGAAVAVSSRHDLVDGNFYPLAHFVMEGGEISGNVRTHTSVNFYAGLNVNGGFFTMHDGIISGNFRDTDIPADVSISFNTFSHNVTLIGGVIGIINNRSTEL